MLTVAVAALSAFGIMLLLLGVVQLRRRAQATRRVAQLMADRAKRGQPAPRDTADRLVELRQFVAQLRAHERNVQEPALAVAGVCGIIGLATISPGWLGLALLSGVAAYVSGAGERRRRRIETQAVEAMALFASGLRAGYSVPQAIELVAARGPQPTASEFAVAAQHISMGVQLADALARLARRTANADYELVAIIIRVQHEVGGNLTQILDSVGDTLRERFELRRQVAALTAQQRLSSVVLTALPFGLLLFLFVTDRSFVEPLFSQSVGRLILATAGLMVFIGWRLLRAVGRIEV
jgi:tight adherence protein B